MITFQDWLTVFTVGCLVVIFPGPNFAMTVRNSLLRSRQAGSYTAVGIALGGTVHVAYSLIGIGVLISQSILLFNVFKWLGVIYLIIIGVRALHTSQHTLQAENGSRLPMSRQEAARSGFLTCLLNPKSTLFFLALFTQVIQPDTPLLARAVYGMTIVAIQLTWYSLLALVISLPAIQKYFSSAAHRVEQMVGGILILLGIRLAFAHGEG